MRFLRLCSLILGIALLVLAGILSFLRQKPAPDWLFLSDLRDYQMVLYRLSLDGHTPEPVVRSNGHPAGLWPRIINGRVYFAATDANLNRHLYSTPLYRDHHEEAIPFAAEFIAFSPDETWLYYTMWRGDSNILFRSRLDGSQIAEIAHFSTTIRCLFAPNRVWLACDSSINHPSLVYVMRPDGSQFHYVVPDYHVQAISRHGSQIVSWSPDGQWLTFTSDHEGRTNLYQIHPNGTALRLISDKANASIVGWSRDSQGLFYTTSSALMYKQVNGETSAQTVLDGHRPNSLVASSDTWLFFQILESTSNYDIYRVRDDGSDLQNITGMSGTEFIVAPSPDGKWLYFSGEIENNSELFRLHLDSLRLERLTYTPVLQEYGGVWSPDGQWLLCVAYSGEERTLTAMRPDGSEAHRIFEGYIPPESSQAIIWSSPPNFPWHNFPLLILALALFSCAFLRTRQT